MDRRRFLQAAAGGVVTGAAACRGGGDAWDRAAHRKTARSRVAILAAGAYDGRLVRVVEEGLRLFPLDVRGRRILLKPNLVEFDPAGVINTHPALLTAAVEAFRRLGAREVIVGEGPGHRRDNEYLLAASGLAAALADTGARYVDLNTDAVERVGLLSRYTGLGHLYLPRSVLHADLVVSMPKLKTHHWAGVTLSMKNLFGLVPGSIYGWPKNVLHWAGIDHSILDINAALSGPRFNIVDGIIGMEGNGPIQGTARASGVVVFGPDPVAVDATCARLMAIDPTRVKYLAAADAFLGNVASERIDQLGEPLQPLIQDYRVLDSFRDLKASETAGS